MATWTFTTPLGSYALSPGEPASAILFQETTGENFEDDAGSTTIIAEGLGAKTLRLEGDLWGAGLTLTDLEGTINALGSALKGTLEISGATLSRYNGIWLLWSLEDAVRAEGGQAKIHYSMELKQGGSFLIFSGSFPPPSGD